MSQEFVRGPRWLGLAHTLSNSCSQMLVVVAETAGHRSSWLWSAGSLGIFIGFLLCLVRAPSHHRVLSDSHFLCEGWMLQKPTFQPTKQKLNSFYARALDIGSFLPCAEIHGPLDTKAQGTDPFSLWDNCHHHHHHCETSMGWNKLFGLVCFLLLNGSRELLTYTILYFGWWLWKLKSSRLGNHLWQRHHAA